MRESQSSRGNEFFSLKNGFNKGGMLILQLNSTGNKYCTDYPRSQIDVTSQFFSVLAHKMATVVLPHRVVIKNEGTKKKNI